MRYADFSGFLKGDPSRIVLLSTFQFDPEFFEARLLRAPSLARARRIVVFVDGSEWSKFLQRGPRGRSVNRRYLVVPVFWSSGVFHPKLGLLMTENGGRVLCGSNNLTRSGCTSNLEILNAIPFNYENADEEAHSLARHVFAFFERISGHTDYATRSIVQRWMTELRNEFSWLVDHNPSPHRQLWLAQTLDKSLWQTVEDTIGSDTPSDFLIISPFHDSDGALLHELTNRYPEADIELVVQQGVSTLPPDVAARLRRVRLSKIAGSSRRVHAKMIAWKNGEGWTCVVGSPNFTTAAFHGRNVETALVIKKANDLVEGLFDEDLLKSPLAISDYEPGDFQDESRILQSSSPVKLTSAVLETDGSLVVSFSYQFDNVPDSMQVELRLVGERLAWVSEKLPLKRAATARLSLSRRVVSEPHGAILAEVVAWHGEEEVRSLPVWAIQEPGLTYDAEAGQTSTTKMIHETGHGLPAYLDKLAERDGYTAVVDYLRHLNIKFHDGANSYAGARRFRVSLDDPYRSDVFPDWQFEENVDSAALEKAISEFVERHERLRLAKHAKLGNINGMENYLDIMRSIVQLMYVWYQRGVFKGPKLVGKLCQLVELSLSGKDPNRNSELGYLGSIAANLNDDTESLQRRCSELGYLAEVRAVLLLAQYARFRIDHPKALPETEPSPQDYLPSTASLVKKSVSNLRLQEPLPETVRERVRAYAVMQSDELRLIDGTFALN